MPSARSKTFLKQAKGKKSKQQLLEDADDYLASATDLEDAMGKHRGGDPVKSLRFAHRALDLYSQGLIKYPRNFDLAYNKARLELEIATHPMFFKYLDVSVDTVLERALESHQYALGIESDNADLLFNMAQLLTTISERIAAEDNSPDLEAIRYLEEALKYQNMCLEVQTLQFRNSHEQIFDDAFDDDDDDGGARLDFETTDKLEHTKQDEQWFSVVEPVTSNTLVDTLLAQLETLTTLCSIISASWSFPSEPLIEMVNSSQIETYSTKIFNDTLPTIVQSSAAELKAREVEIELTKATFLAMFLELTFRSGSTSVHTYRENLSTAFALPAFTQEPSALVAHARALIAFNAAVVDVSSRDASSMRSDHNDIRWNSLSEAQMLLTNASKFPTGDVSLLATTHGLRGDASLLLYGLSHPPFLYLQAISNQFQLLKNAEVFYCNAGKLFDSLGSDWQDDKQTYQFRTAVTKAIQQRQSSGTTDGFKQIQIDIQSIAWVPSNKYSTVWMEEQLGEMIEEGILDREQFVVP